jgi:plastocyanin
MTKRRTAVAAATIVGLAAVTGPLVAGSGASGGAHAAAASIAVSGKEFKFSLSKTSAKHGSITFRFTNTGTIGHDFKIDGKKTPVVQPHKTASLTLNLRKGSYKYLCTVPGHASSGMKGTFKVT